MYTDEQLLKAWLKGYDEHGVKVSIGQIWDTPMGAAHEVGLENVRLLTCSGDDDCKPVVGEHNGILVVVKSVCNVPFAVDVNDYLELGEQHGE